MNKTLLRLKGYLSALKPFVLGWGLVVVLYFGIAINSLVQAIKLTNIPPTPIAALVQGEIEPAQYVKLTGVAFYDSGYYEEAEDGSLIAIIYPLLDYESGFLVFVRTTKLELLELVIDENATVIGRTVDTPGDLKQLIESDFTMIEAEDFTTTATLYVNSDQQPGDVNRLWLQVVGLGFLVGLCGVVLIVPKFVFSPEPIQGSMSTIQGLPKVRVTGNLYKIYPESQNFETTPETHYFSKAESSLAKVGDNGFLLLSHEGVYNMFMGIKFYKRELNWGMKLFPMQTRKIEPGMLYTWDARWAVRITYTYVDNKEEALVFSFDDLNSQLAFLNYLRELGFSVQTLGYSLY